MAVPSNSPPERDDPSALVSASKAAAAAASAPNSSAAPKKRRRRTTAGGATDDCFACRRHNVRCDRKRPYCSQCIDAGKECSGYKTTLTWGVGVASRGKLRGMACPVANKNVDGSDQTSADLDAVRRRRNLTSRGRLSTSGPSPTSMPNSAMPSSHGSMDHLAPHMPVFSHHDHPRSMPIPISQSSSWHMHHPRNSTSPQQTGSPLSDFSSFQPLHLDPSSFQDPGMSLGSYNDTDYHSSVDYPHTPDSISTSEQFSGQSYGGFSEQPQMYHRDSFDAYTNDTLSSVSSLPDLALFSPGLTEPGSLDLSSFAPNDLRYDHLDAFMQQELDGEFEEQQQQQQQPQQIQQQQHHQHQHQQLQNQYQCTPQPPPQHHVQQQVANVGWIDTRFSSTFYQATPRLQSLMNYYEKHVCPYLVTFDGPTNPYRKYVLQLALQNTGLQNALAALATNNIRMRKRESARRATFQDGRGFGPEAALLFETEEPTPEEHMYKQMSIEHLNVQLTEVRAAQDDSVLATLLILCLFHVCDSGFSKFKTQLAGMQKLLSMRDPSTESDFTRWIQMFFTWFDVMTSTVNDRETQVKPESIDMLDYSTNLGALEQFSGCEGKLFKLISRLGRLNLLAQGRQVSPNRSEQARITGPQLPLRMGSSKDLSGQHFGPRASMHPNLETMDGSGWTTQLAPTIKMEPYPAVDSHTDARAAFWADWHDIRSRLEAWQMEAPESKPPVAPDAMQNLVEFEIAQGDLLHINECFRISALLYTERLAQPSLASISEQFQSLVQRALLHITALPITSCVNKFLLWPLFMIGTECVHEGHRNIIRARCAELTRESGFFNNLSCLEVLEKAWTHGDSASELHSPWNENYRIDENLSTPHPQPFQWRRAMDRVDGEYVVV